MTVIHVDINGAGPRVVLVHGALNNGRSAWSKQQELADRWQLVMPTRRGFVPNPPEPLSDYEVDAVDIAALLEDGAHLVGHSYGGLIALFAAALRPDAVRSLTVIEPAVMALVRGDTETERSIASHLELLAGHADDPEHFLAAFTVNLGGDPATVPSPLPDHLHRHVNLLIHERFPWEADIPVDPVRAAPFAKLVVSGGHGAMHETMCDALHDALGPRAERAVIEGAGHNVQRTGAPFNERLEAFWRTAG